MTEYLHGESTNRAVIASPGTFLCSILFSPCDSLGFGLGGQPPSSSTLLMKVLWALVSFCVTRLSDEDTDAINWPPPPDVNRIEHFLFRPPYLTTDDSVSD